MCIHTVKKQKIKKKIKSSPNVPKLGVPGVKNTAKTNKYLGMSCYIQLEHSVFFSW